MSDELPPIPTTEQRTPASPPLDPSRPRRFVYRWDEKLYVDAEGRELKPPKNRVLFVTAHTHGAFTFSTKANEKKPWKVWWRTTPTSSPGYASFGTFEDGLTFLRSLR